MAPGLGIEPRLTESKSVVLPLHNPGTEKNRMVFVARQPKSLALKFAEPILKLVEDQGIEPL